MDAGVACAICGGPTIDLWIAEKSPRAWLRKKREETGDEDPEFSPEEAEWGDYGGYDPDVVTDEDSAWAWDFFLLGLNPDAPEGGERLLLPGFAIRIYVDIAKSSWCDVHELGDDPNLLDDCGEFECYEMLCNIDSQRYPAYPVHPACMTILAKFLTGSNDIASIDKDQLYHVMHKDFEVGHYCLELDYGEPEAERGDWDARPGEEILVTHPLSIPSIKPFISDKLATGTFTPRSSPLPADLGAHVIADPFLALPYDLLHAILIQLDASSLLAFCTASFHVHSAMLPSQTFWKQAVKTSMPWFWEAHDLVGDGAAVDPETTDFRRFYLRLEKSSRPAAWMDPGPFVGVANRRRIWDVCGQLAAKYWVREAAALGECSLSVEHSQVLMKDGENEEEEEEE